ncbi:hypothetical protein V1525DRAFT_82989 [Lipomyces kononenkoae]|uniref:Uncharacterized protein n=1 Tax=Lipomyces kononenkoae TaxID=34357 RepID=A0ACC3SRU6_LIPKO
MRASLTTLALVYLDFVAAVSNALHSTRDEDYGADDIITRDVCIVGGGSGGTYAATRLRELGQSVVIIEKEPIMGGHTNTYTVPSSGEKIDYGVVVFHNTSIVRNYFAHYNVALGPAITDTANTTVLADFRTGDVINFILPDPSAALVAWVTQLEKYPFLATGINLPDPVPADLLIPFKDFVQKYNLSDLVQTITELGQGYADLLEQPTLYAMKLLSIDLVQTLESGFIATAARDNHLIYDAATIEFTLANSLLLSSHILSVQRNSNSNGISKIVVKTPSGSKLIKAKKIVVAFPPIPSNFEGWDLDDQERDVFNTYKFEAYYTGLVTNTGLPLSTDVDNVGANTPFNIPALPGMYGFDVTAQPGLIDVKYASPFVQSDSTVKSNIQSALGRLQIPGVTTTPGKLEWKAFQAHVPFFDHVTAEDIQGGFYTRANALQGHRRVWYTGAAWESQDSSAIWSFTESLLQNILQAETDNV